MIFRLSKNDVIVLACLSFFAILFALVFVNFSFPPFEDAAILMRYSENFAHGYGIVWNIGEVPVDGATDFLFMVVLGMFVKAGLGLELATRLIGFSAHILTIWIIYVAQRRLFNAPILFAIISALYLTVGPGFFYVAGYFGTTFFALFACLAWYIALDLMQAGDQKQAAQLFAFVSLATALIRPEGIILTGLMLLAIIFSRGLKASWQIILNYGIVFLLIGGAYFVWRWNYFGYPLPNPYYKKGGGFFYPSSLEISLIYTFFLCLPFSPAFIVGLIYQKTRKLTLAALIPILGFASAFILLSNEMNIGARFQYALLPIALMVCWPLSAALRDSLKVSRWFGSLINQRLKLMIPLTILAAGSLVYIFSIGRFQYGRDGKYDLALMLSGYKDRGLTLAASEAGLLPLYSGLKSLDIWGLNDAWIAHNGKITEAYLQKFNPDIIMFHMVFPAGVSDPVTWFPVVQKPTKVSQWDALFLRAETKDNAWVEMAGTVKDYAEQHGYTQAAVFGTMPNNFDFYYVRPGFPESAEIVERIRTFKYYKISSEGFAKNFLLP